MLIGIVIGLLAGVIIGFLTGVHCTIEADDKAIKNGYISSKGKVYRLTEIKPDK